MNEDKSIIETTQSYLDRTGSSAWEAFLNRYNIDYNDSNELVSAINENECEADYFRRLLECSERAKEAVKTHETWKRRHMNGLRELDCMQRILIVLGELLKSDFLRYDWFDTGFPKKDREQAVKELREQGFEELLQTEGADWKFALLDQLRSQEESRIVIEEHKAGFYISEMHDKLSVEAVEAFCRFVTFTRLAYQEIDRLKKENRDRELEGCIKKMLTDLEPLHVHIVSDFSESYDELLNGILLVSYLQKKLKQVSPNTFKGGYNQKLTCNLVGLLCGEGVYDVNPKQADALIYTGKTHYTYINNYANYDSSDSELTREEVKAIKELIKKVHPTNA